MEGTEMVLDHFLVQTKVMTKLHSEDVKTQVGETAWRDTKGNIK